MDKTNGTFDAEAKAAQLVEESTSWDTSVVVPAAPEDIPTVDVGAYFRTGDLADLTQPAETLRYALEEVGFHQLVGHGMEPQLMRDILDTTRRFHALPLSVKRSILIDQPDHPVGGVGYMPVGTRKLPTRDRGNPNEAFLIKRDRDIDFADNRWLPEAELPGFRNTVERYATAITDLARRLLPVYATALDLEADFFAEGFTHPFSRLRMTHYPSNPTADNGTATDSNGADSNPVGELGSFGIPPHVDTTFITLLLPDSPGLTIYSRLRDQWILAPVVPGAFIVNAGELLRQWSNDRVLSTRHFANNTSDESRYSVPFFFNATADYPMTCLPSCCGPDNPPRYPTFSYLESQGVVQGE